MSGADWVARHGLIRFCEGVEKGRSLFENELRKLSIPVMDVFLEDGRFVPAGFEFSGERLVESESAVSYTHLTLPTN